MIRSLALRLLVLVLPCFGTCLLAQDSQTDSLQQSVIAAVERGLDVQAALDELARFNHTTASRHEQAHTWLTETFPGDTLSTYYFYLVFKNYRRLSSPEAGMKYLHRSLHTAQSAQIAHRCGILSELGKAHRRYSLDLDSSTYYLFAAIQLVEGKHDYYQWMPYFELSETYRIMGNGKASWEALIKSLQFARLPPQKRAHYGLVLYYIIQNALHQGRNEAYREYIQEYVGFMHAAVSVNRRHDAVLNHLIKGPAAIEELKATLRDAVPIDGSNASSIGYSYFLLANGLMNEGLYEEALSNLRRSLSILAPYDQGELYQNGYELLWNLGKQAGRPEIELEGLRKFSQLRDSMNLITYNEAVSEWEVKYETQQKDALLAQQELALVRTQQQRNGILFGGILLAALAGAIFLFLRNQLKLQRLQTQQEQFIADQQIAHLKKENQLTRLRAMIEGQEGERRRVAKDLHDGLGGLLTTVRAHVSRLVPTTHETETPILDLLDQASKDVRRLAHNMMPSQLAAAGLSASLEDVRGKLILQGLECELEIQGHPENILDDTQQSMVLQIVQELTHNITKHAGAQFVLIQLLQFEADVLLTIEDDGKGFNPERVRRENGSMGLQSIEDRATFLNATLSIDSARGRGTTVSLRIPQQARTAAGPNPDFYAV